MGNDLLVIPCDLSANHEGPCERNIWPVDEIAGRRDSAESEQEEDELVVEIARELYDRFVMGGWEPQDAYPQIRVWMLESRK